MDKPAKQMKPTNNISSSKDKKFASKEEEMAHLTTDFRVHIPALDKVKEDDDDAICTKVKDISKSSSESGKSSVSIESKEEQKSAEENSSQL